MPAPKNPLDEYFKQSGWPSNIDGSLRRVVDLDKEELRDLARRYASVLQTEFGSIVIPEKPRGG